MEEDSGGLAVDGPVAAGWRRSPHARVFQVLPSSMLRRLWTHQ